MNICLIWVVLNAPADFQQNPYLIQSFCMLQKCIWLSWNKTQWIDCSQFPL